MIPSVAAWLPYMSASVCHKPRGGQDSYGEATTTSTGIWYPAHIEQVVTAAGGVTPAITGQLHLIIGAIVAIDPQDTLLIQRPFTTRGTTGTLATEEEAQIVRVGAVLGPVLGHHHTEVWTE